MKQIHRRCCPQTVISHSCELVDANGAVVSSTAPSRQVIAAALLYFVHNTTDTGTPFCILLSCTLLETLVKTCAKTKKK